MGAEPLRMIGIRNGHWESESVLPEASRGADVEAQRLKLMLATSCQELNLGPMGDKDPAT